MMTFNKTGMKRILKNASDNAVVSNNAVTAFTVAVEEYSKLLAKESYKAAKHADRRSIQEKDIKFALEQL